MKRYSALAVVLLCSFLSCQSKKKEEKKNFISVVSLIKKQVDHIDTSLYSIRRVIIYDSLHRDTSYIPREAFRDAAREFLAIPDLSLAKVARKYKEEPARYDELLGRVILNYAAIDPDKEEYKNQEILITPGTAEGDKVNNILVNRSISNRDSFLLKRMLWQMDKSFQITTITQKPGEPEKTVTEKVSWNEDSEQ